MSSPPVGQEAAAHAALEAFRDDLLDAVEHGPGAVGRALDRWCDRCPRHAETFRAEARAVVALWGLREPERLGAYRLLDVLAVGGMGKVYRAREDVTGRVVAVKTVLGGHLSPAEQVARFDTERRLLSRLHDTHIVPLLATGQEGYLLYLVMPFIPGATLRTLIATCSSRGEVGRSFPTFDTLFAAASAAESHARKSGTVYRGECDPDGPAGSSDGPPPTPAAGDHRPGDYLRRVVAMMAHVAGAVQHIHDARILHRDLKPSNIMVDASGHSWVIDIGVGRDLAAGPRPDDPAPSGARGEVTRGAGTLSYMAPEQLPDGLLPSPADPPPGQDARVDVWGLGATLYELLTLRPPFGGETPGEVARKILTEPPVAPRRHQPAIPRELEAICLKALGKDPDDRYPTAAAFGDDLRRWLDGHPTLAGKAGPVRRTAMWARRKPAAAGLVAAGVFILFLISSVSAYEALAQAAARQRDADLLAVQQLRQPTRRAGWSRRSWNLLGTLRGGDTSPDPNLQANAAAALEGADVDKVATMRHPAQSVAFDPLSARVLVTRLDTESMRRGRPWTRTTLFDRTPDRVLAERDLGLGVVGFGPDGTPLQLSWVRGQGPGPPSRTSLKLFDVASGRALHEYRPEVPGPFDITAIALARLGSRLAAVSVPVRPKSGELAPDDRNKTITVWDVGPGRPVRTLGHGRTQDLTLSPDGRMLAAWDTAGEVSVWALPDGKPLGRFRVGRMPVTCLAFGRDPYWYGDESVPPWVLTVGESSGLVTVWDLRLARPRSVCRGTSFTVTGLDFSADGSLLLSAGAGANLWSAATGACLAEVAPGGVSYVTAGLSDDGRRFAVGAEDPALDLCTRVADLEPGRGIRTLHGVQGVVQKTVFSPDGRFVAAATHEWQTGIWEWPSGRLAGVLPTPIGVFADNMAIAFDATGRRFACSAGHQAQLWDVEARRLLGEWTLPEALCESLAFPGPGRLTLVRSETRSGTRAPFRDGDPSKDADPKDHPRVVRVYDLLGRTPTRARVEVHDFPIHVKGIALAPDGSAFTVDGIATEGTRAVTRAGMYASATGRRVTALATRHPVGGSGWGTVDPSGRFVGINLSPASPGKITLLDWSGRVFDELPAVGAILGPGAELFAAADSPNGFLLRRRGRAEPLLRIARDTHTGAGSFAFSPNGLYCAIGNTDGTVSVVDLVETRKRLGELRLGW
jgi:serine/threonine protein kinase/WD40 repeat protein